MVSVAVLAPSPLLTITIEAGTDGPEVHLHAGGQGFWIARMVRELGVDVLLCATFGGETGMVAHRLIEAEDLRVRAIPIAGNNPAYLHDRRSGERQELVTVPPPALSRHELDDLYGTALVAGLDADVAVLGGPVEDELPAEVYGRFARDLRANGRTVIADLSGEPLSALLDGGVDVLKASHEDLRKDGRLDGDDDRHHAEALRALAKAGAEHVVLTRAERSTLALIDGDVLEVIPPTVEPLDHRGAGDSLTAGLAVALARGEDLPSALRLGTAAGSLNATRHGLATGNREDIERLAAMVRLHKLEDVT